MKCTQEMFQAGAIIEDQFNQIQDLISSPYQMSNEEINEFQNRCEKFVTLFNRWSTNIIVNSKMPSEDEDDGTIVG